MTRGLLIISLALLGCHRTPPRDAIVTPSALVGVDASGEEMGAAKDAGANDDASAADAVVATSSAELPIEPPPPPPKNDPRCPAKMRIAQGQACTDDIQGCQYNDGDCSCAPGPWCSGTAPPPSPGPHKGTWVCTPNDQKAVRADGCPFLLVPGIPCKQKGRVCVYPTCLWQRESATCDGKKWIPKFEQLFAPPP